MKINNIKALDYERQGNTLALTLSETTLEAITSMNTALMSVQTDDGDTVEVFVGYALRSVAYDLATRTYTAVLSTEASDTTAAALSKMAGELTEAKDKVRALEQANRDLAGQLAELSSAIERGLTE